MERFFQVTAVILAGVAAYFLWTGNADRAFAAAVFGAVSFFLSVRVQVKARLREREIQEEEKRRRGEEENFEPTLLDEMPANSQIVNEQRTTSDEQKI
jgi:hypothetical protein